MKTNTPQQLKDLFELMQEDVALSRHLSDTYLENLVEVICWITESCEIKHEDEWVAMKCIRNGLRDLINK